MRESLHRYRGIGSGAAELREGERESAFPGLTGGETTVLRALLELGEAPAAVARGRGRTADAAG